MPSKKFVLFNGCDEIVALRLARQRIQHDKTSRGSFVPMIRLKHTHDRQATDDRFVVSSSFFYRLIPTNSIRPVLYSIIQPHECTD